MSGENDIWLVRCIPIPRKMRRMKRFRFHWRKHPAMAWIQWPVLVLEDFLLEDSPAQIDPGALATLLQEELNDAHKKGYAIEKLEILQSPSLQIDLPASAGRAGRWRGQSPGGLEHVLVIKKRHDS